MKLMVNASIIKKNKRRTLNIKLKLKVKSQSLNQILFRQMKSKFLNLEKVNYLIYYQKRKLNYLM